MNLRRLSSVSLGHLAIDILNSSIAMILTAMAVPFDLGNKEIGLGVMTYQLVGSLSQPYFGWLADRFSGRWLGALGLLWTIVFFFAATFSQSYGMLLLFMSLAALGSGAFHPQGAMNASAAGRQRASSATAIFFLLGQTGLAFGPIIAGIVLERSGLAGPRLMAIAALPAVLFMAAGLRSPLTHSDHAEESEAPADAKARSADTPPTVRQNTNRSMKVVAAFGLLVALRATVQQGYYGLLPKFFADQGYSPAEYGSLVGIFSITLAIGTLVGGYLGDRYDNRKLLIWTLILTTPFTFAMLFSASWLYLVLAALAGFMVGIPHSILVVMAQRLMPRRQGFASGAVLGFMFATGAIGTGLFGIVADTVGMAGALQAIALLPLGAAVGAYFLPQPRRSAAAGVVAPATSSAGD